MAAGKCLLVYVCWSMYLGLCLLVCGWWSMAAGNVFLSMSVGLCLCFNVSPPVIVIVVAAVVSESAERY